jgi:hypothetical protein
MGVFLWSKGYNTPTGFPMLSQNEPHSFLKKFIGKDLWQHVGKDPGFSWAAEAPFPEGIPALEESFLCLSISSNRGRSSLPARCSSEQLFVTGSMQTVAASGVCRAGI